MKIDIVSHPSGDWEGLYIDGRLEKEDHSIQVEDLMIVLQCILLEGKPITNIAYSQWEADIKMEKYSYTNSDGTVDEWEDYPTNMPQELPERA